MSLKINYHLLHHFKNVIIILIFKSKDNAEF